MSAVLKVLWTIATFMIPIPLALIAAAWAWVAIDKHSAVRRAVDKAVTEMVSGAQIAALEAQVAEERRLRAFMEGKAAALETANKRFDDARQAAEQENERLDDELEATKRAPAPAECVVTDDLLGRLSK